MKRCLLILAVLSLTKSLSYADDQFTHPDYYQEVSQLFEERHPNWTSKVIKKFPSGHKYKVHFFEPTRSGVHPIEEIFYYPSGAVHKRTEISQSEGQIQRDGKGFVYAEDGTLLEERVYWDSVVFDVKR